MIEKKDWTLGLEVVVGSKVQLAGVNGFRLKLISSSIEICEIRMISNQNIKLSGSTYIKAGRVGFKKLSLARHQTVKRKICQIIV
jgi:hypothetical protein